MGDEQRFDESCLLPNERIVATFPEQSCAAHVRGNFFLNPSEFSKPPIPLLDALQSASSTIGPSFGVITNYRYIFVAGATRQPYFAIPLTDIHSWEKGGSHKLAKTGRYTLTLYLKSPGAVIVAFSSDESNIRPRKSFVATLTSVLQGLMPSPDTVFAFNQPPAAPGRGWALFDPVAEFTRMGITPDKPPVDPNELVHDIGKLAGSIALTPEIPADERTYWCSYDHMRQRYIDGSSVAPAPTAVSPPTHRWRLTYRNSNYALSPTYPAVIAVPMNVSDTDLVDAAMFRSNRRFLALSWRWHGHGSITRCAQPGGGSSEADKRMFRLVCEDAPVLDLPAAGSALPQTRPKVFIFDARPKLNAMVNRVMGKGSEDVSEYGGANLIYLGIPNIHVVRDSWKSMRSAYIGDQVTLPLPTPTNAPGGPLANSLPPGAFRAPALPPNYDRAVADPRLSENAVATAWTFVRDAWRKERVLGGSEKGFLSRVDGSGWLDMVRLILSSANMIADVVARMRCHAVVHCSDGWDRTSQLTALSMLLLDPYYRTMEGFAVLIEKEWCAFGHRFSTRARHPGGSVAVEAAICADHEEADSPDAPTTGAKAGADKTPSGPAGSESQSCPVFIQWLDCVRVLLEQMPSAFEFNEDFLLYIAFHVYSCRYGTFIYDNERHRAVHGVPRSTTSIWDDALYSPLRQCFVNREFWPLPMGRQLVVNVSARRVGPWLRYWTQHVWA